MADLDQMCTLRYGVSKPATAKTTILPPSGLAMSSDTAPKDWDMVIVCAYPGPVLWTSLPFYHGLCAISYCSPATTKHRSVWADQLHCVPFPVSSPPFINIMQHLTPSLQPLHQIWSMQHPVLTFSVRWDVAFTAGRNYSIWLLVWYQLIRSPWGSHVIPPRPSYPSCKIWITMFFEVYPDPLIKDKDFKTLFFTANSSGHELYPWHGKSSSANKEKTTKPHISLSLQAREKYTLVADTLLDFGKSVCYFWTQSQIALSSKNYSALLRVI